MHLIFKKLIGNSTDGFITLISILVAGAVSVAIAVSLILLGLGSSRMSYTQEESNKAKALALACAEEALGEIRNSWLFSGTNTLAFGQGLCIYTVTNLGGEDRQITSQGTVNNVTRKVIIFINDIKPKINITLWQEVPDF